MHVIYLHQYFNTPDMSGGTRSFEMGRRLVAAGHQVTIITTWQQPTNNKGWFVTDVEGMQVHWLPVRYSNRMGYAARIKAFMRFAVRAALKAAKIPGDIVFATSTPLTIAIPGIFSSRRLRVPMIFEVRDLWPELPIAIGALKNPLLRWSARILERTAYASSSAVIALSPGMADGVVRAGYPREKITVVPNASDLDLFKRDAQAGLEFRRRRGIDPEKIVVAYVGTFGRINDVCYMVRVAAALRGDPRFVFLAVGDGMEFDRVAALAAAEGVIEKNFFMMQKIAKAEVPALLSAADIAMSLFLPIPQMEANSANKFFDALAAGCCLVINYGGWQAELLQQAEAGIRVSNDASTAAQELRKLADWPGRIAAAGANARRLAEERFSRDSLVKVVQGVFAQVLSKPR